MEGNWIGDEGLKALAAVLPQSQVTELGLVSFSGVLLMDSPLCGIV